MIDRIFGALLTFCLLAAGTVAIGSAMLDYDRQAGEIRQTGAAQQVVHLPAVEVTVKRATVAQTDAAEPSARNLQ
jgi:hypothetical protein